MGHIANTVHVRAPLEEVFRLAAQWERLPEWNPSFVEVRDITGPGDQVGTRFGVRMLIAGRQIEGTGEVVEVVSPTLLKVRFSGLAGGTLDWVRRFERVDDGTTYAFTLDYELPGGLFGQIADRLLVERLIEHGVTYSTETFTILAEARVPQPA